MIQFSAAVRTIPPVADNQEVRELVREVIKEEIQPAFLRQGSHGARESRRARGFGSALIASVIHSTYAGSFRKHHRDVQPEKGIPMKKIASVAATIATLVAITAAIPAEARGLRINRAAGGAIAAAAVAAS